MKQAWFWLMKRPSATFFGVGLSLVVLDVRFSYPALQVDVEVLWSANGPGST